MKSTGNPELDAVLRPQLQPVRNIDDDVDRYLALLRKLIRRRGFTQLQVQQALGWGRSYISQLLTSRKPYASSKCSSSILALIGVEPAAFFAEIYHHPAPHRSPRRAAAAALPGPQQAPQLPHAGLHGLQAVLDGLVTLLEEKGLLTTAELSAAIEKAKQGP